MMKNILVIDDHALTRMGIISIINERYRARVCEAGNVQQALHCLDAEQFDLVLLGINVPDGHSLRLVGQIRERQGNVKIFVFSGHGEFADIVSFLKKGVNGYLLKTCTVEQFIEALEIVQGSRKYVSSEIEQMIVQDFLNIENSKLKADKLSRRELEIAKLLMQGHRVSSVCDILNLKPSTVSTIKRNIFSKLKINNIVDLSNVLALR